MAKKKPRAPNVRRSADFDVTEHNAADAVRAILEAFTVGPEHRSPADQEFVEATLRAYAIREEKRIEDEEYAVLIHDSRLALYEHYKAVLDAEKKNQKWDVLDRYDDLVERFEKIAGFRPNDYSSRRLDKDPDAIRRAGTKQNNGTSQGPQYATDVTLAREGHKLIRNELVARRSPGGMLAASFGKSFDEAVPEVVSVAHIRKQAKLGAPLKSARPRRRPDVEGLIRAAHNLLQGVKSEHSEVLWQDA